MSERAGAVRIRAYCICGGKLDAFSEPPEAAEEVHRLFRLLHSRRDGHRPCDAATAARARRKERAA